MTDKLREALAEIAEQDGLCIYGCPAIADLGRGTEHDEAGKWFQAGSAMAFAETGRIAKAALAADAKESDKHNAQA